MLNPIFMRVPSAPHCYFFSSDSGGSFGTATRDN